MGNIVRFAEESSRRGFTRIQSSYSAREISRQFGLDERRIRRWTEEGLICKAEESRGEESRYDLRTLDVFRRVRDMRHRGLTFRQIEAELQGQLNLFPGGEGEVVALPRRTTAFQEALLLHEKGDAGAAQWYLKAAAEGDHVPDAYCNLGILHFQARNIADAFDCFTQALAADPRHFESHFNLAHLYFEAGDLRLARVHYEMAAKIEPSFADLYYNLGLVHALDGALPEALAALRQARDLVPEEERERVDEVLSTVREELAKAPPPDRERR